MRNDRRVVEFQINKLIFFCQLNRKGFAADNRVIKCIQNQNRRLYI